MYNFLMSLWRNKKMLFVFLLTPILLIISSNFSPFFLSMLIVMSSLIKFDDDLTFVIALPISRKSVVQGNYLFYGLFSLFYLTYLGICSYLLKMLLSVELDESFSLTGFIMVINYLAIFSLAIPLLLQLKLKANSHFQNIIMVIGIALYFVVNTVFAFGFDFFDKLNLFVYLGVSLVFISLIFAIGYRYSLKLINKLEF